MALQYNVDSVDTLSEEIRGLYVQDGDKYRLDVTDVKPMAEFQKVYQSLDAERSAHKSTKGILGKFGDTTPESLDDLRNQLTEAQARSGEIDDEKIETIVAARTKPYERDKEKLATQNLELQAKIVELDEVITTGKRESMIFDMANGKIKPEFIKDAQLRAKYELKFDAEQGKFGDEFGATVEDWFAWQLENTPSWVMDSTSAGAKGGKGGGIGKNPFDRNGPDFNMTEGMRIIKIEPKRALQMAAAAGVDISSLM